MIGNEYAGSGLVGGGLVGGYIPPYMKQGYVERKTEMKFSRDWGRVKSDFEAKYQKSRPEAKGAANKWTDSSGAHPSAAGVKEYYTSLRLTPQAIANRNATKQAVRSTMADYVTSTIASGTGSGRHGEPSKFEYQMEQLRVRHGIKLAKSSVAKREGFVGPFVRGAYPRSELPPIERGFYRPPA